MRKALTFAAAIALVSTQAFAAYIVVLKDGTRYKAKSKWTTVGSKATITLENGQTLQINTTDIDAAKSEQVSKLGLGDVGIIGVEQANPQQAPAQQPSLGSTVRLRKPPTQPTTPAVSRPVPSTGAAPAPAPALAANPGILNSQIIGKFERAYENLGIFEHKIVSTGANSMRADLTADSEDRVFNAISATSFLMVRNAGVDGARIDTIELFMKTTTGGSSGHFQMNRQDAESLDKKALTLQEYFVRKVIFSASAED